MDNILQVLSIRMELIRLMPATYDPLDRLLLKVRILLRQPALTVSDIQKILSSEHSNEEIFLAVQAATVLAQH